MFAPDTLVVIVKWFKILLKCACGQEEVQLGNKSREFGRHADK